MKTHRGAAKRFKITGTGKVRHKAAYKNHILTKKTTKRKRHARGGAQVDAADQHQVERMLPYGL